MRSAILSSVKLYTLLLLSSTVKIKEVGDVRMLNIPKFRPINQQLTTHKTTNCNRPNGIFPDKMKMQTTRGSHGNKNRRDQEMQRLGARIDTTLSFTVVATFRDSLTAINTDIVHITFNFGLTHTFRASIA